MLCWHRKLVLCLVVVAVSLIEIVSEAAEDGLLCGTVAFEVVAVAEALDGFVLVAAERLRNIDTDVDNEVAHAIAVALYGGQSLSTQAKGLAGWVPGSIFIFTRPPSMVGISTLPPSVAVGKSSNRL